MIIFAENLQLISTSLTKMKTKKQILAFLKANKFTTAEDCELVSLYCQNSCGLTPKDFPTFDEPGDINAQMFLEWFKNGFGIGDIAKDSSGDLNVVCSSSVDSVVSCAFLSNSLETGKKWTIKSRTLDPKELSHVCDDTLKRCVTSLGMFGREIDFDTCKLRKKYIPACNERVEFFYKDQRGIGVVRSINEAENSIELFCYFDYNDKSIGYSMHETGVCDVCGWHFKPMNIIAQRRLNRELGRFDKVWNEKLHRVEPVNPKAKKGENYWYISDKMTVVTDREKVTPTSHYRYLAGNYFLSHDEALVYLSKFTEILRDRLAK